MNTRPAHAVFALPALLILAAALRLAMAMAIPNLIWADEIYQVIEPAWRLVHGPLHDQALVSWEFLIGMRAWLFPGAIAAVLWLAHAISAQPQANIVAVQLFMVAAALIPVAVAWRWGARLDGTRGALMLGGFTALWVDLVYFAPHSLADVIAGQVLMAALYAALPLNQTPGARRLAVAGLLLGLTFVLRIQLAPALLVAAIFACRRSWRAWAPLLAGGTTMLIASGLLDWITLGSPFRSLWLNVWVNLFAGVSGEYGVQPHGFFLGTAVLFWGLAALPVLMLFVLGARRFPALAAVVAAILLTQSLIAHKEWRFLYPALPPLITLCAIGALEVIGDMHRRWPAIPGNRMAAAALLAWGVLSLLVAIGPGYRLNWTHRREALQAFALAARQPGLCGVDLVGLPWAETPGHAFLPRGVPVYANDTTTVLKDARAYNVAIGGAQTVVPGFHRLQCLVSADGPWAPDQPATICVWSRQGSCTPGAGQLATANWPVYFLDDRGQPRPDRIRPLLVH